MDFGNSSWIVVVEDDVVVDDAYDDDDDVFDVKATRASVASADA